MQMGSHTSVFALSDQNRSACPKSSAAASGDTIVLLMSLYRYFLIESKCMCRIRQIPGGANVIHRNGNIAKMVIVGCFNTAAHYCFTIDHFSKALKVRGSKSVSNYIISVCKLQSCWNSIRVESSGQVVIEGCGWL